MHQRVDPDLQLEPAEADQRQRGSGQARDARAWATSRPARTGAARYRSQDGRYSRRCACLATHSSAPTCGPPAGLRRLRIEAHGRVHTFCSWAWPSSPLGRTSITTISSANTSRLVYVEEM